MTDLILFGAGASYGSQPKNVPPLGANLFDELRKFGKYWNQIPKELVDVFKTDFEKGMEELGNHYPMALAPLQREMAVYFFNFNATKDNLYVKLASLIKKTKWKGAISTLNYERLLEQSLLYNGLKCIIGRPTSNSYDLELNFPHGCCNFLCEGIVASNGVFFTGNNISTSGRVVIENNPVSYIRKIRENQFPPVMSYFDPSKFTTSCSNFIIEQRKRYRELVLNAEKIAIVGLRVREHDNHIWNPLKQTSATIYYCSGKSAGDEFEKWRKKSRPNSNDEIYKMYFREGFNTIFSKLGLIE